MNIKILIPLILLISGCSCPQASGPVISRFARHSSQNKWELASAVYIDSKGLSDNTVMVRSLWDEDSLYFRFDVRDADLWATQTEHDDVELYLDDMCEVLIDPRRDSTDLWLEDDIIYHVNLLGTIKDDRGQVSGGQDITWNGKANCRVEMNGTMNDSSDIDEGYDIEISVPWEEIGMHPYDRMKINVNFGCGDRDAEIRKRCLFFLRNCVPTRTPSSFTTLELVL